MSRRGKSHTTTSTAGLRRASGHPRGLAYRFAKIWPSITHTAEPATVCRTISACSNSGNQGKLTALNREDYYAGGGVGFVIRYARIFSKTRQLVCRKAPTLPSPGVPGEGEEGIAARGQARRLSSKMRMGAVRVGTVFFNCVSD